MIYKVNLFLNKTMQNYYTEANSADQAISKVADAIEDRDYTWFNIQITDINHVEKTMDVGAGAYKMIAYPLPIIR